jgi:EPS-associated MarR family transcriptional regulator
MSDKQSHLESEEVLKLLKEIKKTPKMTQRELSVKVGISLGKINFLIRSLIEAGIIKVDNFKKSNNKSVYLYFLTPHGIEEVTRITCHFLKRKMKEYEQLNGEIEQLKKEVSDLGIPSEADEKVFDTERS